MSDKIDFIIIFIVKVFLKRKNDVHTLNILFDFEYPGLLPGPDLRGNIVEHPDPMLSSKAGNTQVKSGIIHQDQHIGLIIKDIPTAKFHIPDDGHDVHQHLHKSHKSQFVVMLHKLSTLSLHQITAPTPEVCVRIPLL